MKKAFEDSLVSNKMSVTTTIAPSEFASSIYGIEDLRERVNLYIHALHARKSWHENLRMPLFPRFG